MGGGSVTQAQQPHCDCLSLCVCQCCMSGSLNDLRRLARKTQDLPAERGNTHREGRNRQAWLESDIIPVYAFVFLFSLPSVKKEQLIFCPPPPSSLTLPHIHYYDFQLLLLHHHHYHTLRRCSSSDVWKQKRWGVKEREGASVMHC